MRDGDGDGDNRVFVSGTYGTSCIHFVGSEPIVSGFLSTEY